MKKNAVFSIFFGICVTAFFASCASLQKDVIMSTDSYIQDEDVIFLEKQYIQYDAKCILEGTFTAESSEYLALEDLKKDIEDTIVASGLNKIVDSRLYALEGLVNLLQGNKAKAKTLYTKSLDTNKGDSYTIILGSRIGVVEAIDDENVVSGSNQSILLTLEQGLKDYSEGKYTDCVAKLDSVFLELPDYYKEAYQEIRQNAWALKNNANQTEDKNVLNLLNKSKISAGEMALITQETTDLFVTENGGKKFSENDLFTRLKNADYFSPCSNAYPIDKKDELKKGDTVTRTIAARFLWNIICSKSGDASIKTKNSVLFREKVLSSPIPDVDLYSNDFDAILGVVENEIMALPDGVNFFPEESVSASELNQYLQQIR